MSYSDRLKAAKRFVDNRENEKQKKMDDIRAKCDKALAVVQSYSKDIKEITELYGYCVSNRIPLKNSNNCLFDNGSSNYGFSLSLGSLYGIDILLFHKGAKTLQATRDGIVRCPYLDDDNYISLVDTFGALTAFADLFPNFKLSFYTAFDKAVGYEEKRSKNA